MQERYDAIVIGAGLGGLTGGALLARAGYQVLVLEKNAQVGGAATCFERDGQRCEVSLHETMAPGTGVADPKAQIIRALGLEDRVEFVPVGDFQEVRSPALGTPVLLPQGLDKVDAVLAARFPGQAEAITRFLVQIGRTQEAMAALSERHDSQWWLGHAADLPLDLWAVMRDMRHSLSDVMGRYFGDDELIKLVLAANLPYYSDDPDRLWWLAYAVAQGGYLTGGGHYIKGGSAKLSEALVEVIREAGGAVLTGHEVTRIVTGAEGQATGVQVKTGPRAVTEVAAPVILSNAAPAALEGMLPEAQRAGFLEPFAGKPLSISLFTVNFALSRPAAELGVNAYSTVLLPDWMESLDDFRAAAPLLGAAPAGRMPPMVVVDYGQIDSGLGPVGPVSVTGVDRLENWEGLDEAAYAARKAEWVAAIRDRLEAEWPGFAAAVTGSDMATARTMRDYLGTPGGAVYGFAPEVPKSLVTGPGGTVRTAVPGLFLASAWAGFGGFSGAMGAGAMAARAAIRALG